MTTYSIVGLGKLGASMAAGIAKRGFNAIGVDVNQHAVDALNAGRAPVQETNLAETIAANRERLRATMSHQDAVHNSDLTFVVVPTPSDNRGAFSIQYAGWAFREIGRALADKPGYHNVVLTSTVLPGATRYGLIPILEAESGKKAGRDFGVCYSPEFIALGSVLRDFLNPDFTLIGEIDERAGEMLAASYDAITENHPPCKRMSIENAELTKIAVNTYVTTKITFANMLADLCERIPGGDIDVVTDALGSDARIGAKYLKGALGYGGPCFPRDNLALGFFARAMGTRARLAETTDETNRQLPQKFVEWLKPQLKPGMTVAVMGLAYKPFSHVIEESQGMALALALAKAGVRVVAYDPLAGAAAQQAFEDKVVVLDTLADCLAQADVVLLTNADPEFRRLRARDLNHREGSVMIVDFWRILEQEFDGQSHVHYVPIGNSRDDDANAARLRDLWRPLGS